jgi:hypothetical protein
MPKHCLWKFISLALTIVVVVVACAPRPAWVTTLFKAPVCTAPCWNNITPGKTSREELSQILKQDSNTFDITASVGDPWGPVLSWCEGGSPCRQGDLSVLSAFDSQGIVQELYLRPGSPLYLKDFIPLYGSPEKLVFSDTLSAPGYILVGLLYPKLGLVLEFLSENRGSTSDPAVDFQEDLEVNNIIYTLPGLEYYYSTNIVSKRLDQFEWKGYTRYP